MNQRRLSLIALTAILLLPAGEAATISTDLQTVWVVPDTAETPVHLTVEMTCQEFVQAGGVPNGLNIPITVAAEDKDVLISGPASLPMAAADCASPTANTITADGDYQVSATRNAPGLTEIKLEFSANIPAAPGGTATDVTTTTIAIVDFFPLIQAVVEEPVQNGRGPLEYEVTLTNLGNSNTRVHFELDEGDSDQILLPQDVIVGSAAKGNDNQVTAIVNVDGNAGLKAIVIRLEISALDDPAKTGDDVTVPLVQSGKGAPGFEALMVPLALLGAALWTSRRID